MENITNNTLLFEIENKISEAKEEKKNIVAKDKENPILEPLNARINSLVLIKSELIRENKSNVYHLTKDKEIILLNQMAEKRVQNIKDYSNNGRQELAEQEEKELQIINEFLPKMPTEEEIKQFINDKIDEYIASQTEGYKLTMKDIGKVKPMVNATYPTVSGNLIKDELMKRI